MDKETYTYLAEEARQQLIALAASFLHDNDAADDVVQESLLRLWLMRERIEAEQDFKALAVRITKNVCISLWRQQQKMHTVPLEALSATDRCYRQADMEDDEGQQHLERAISQLPPAERRIFLLWRQNLDIQEIASITGAKPRSVSSCLSMVRRKLCQQLKDEHQLPSKH